MIPRWNSSSSAMDITQGFDICTNENDGGGAGVEEIMMEVEVNSPVSPIEDLPACQVEGKKEEEGEVKEKEKDVKQGVKAITKAKKRRLMTGAGGKKPTAAGSKKKKSATKGKAKTKSKSSSKKKSTSSKNKAKKKKTSAPRKKKADTSKKKKTSKTKKKK